MSTEYVGTAVYKSERLAPADEFRTVHPPGWTCTDFETAARLRDVERRARADDVWGSRNAWSDIANAQRLAVWEKKRAGVTETDLPRGHTRAAETRDDSPAATAIDGSIGPARLRTAPFQQ
ncbi:MAG TPA: hypothetical protein VGG69_07195 [Rhizomicrobium sp.]|jgi:hypothetical protein